jgi:hypothetical protein
MLGMADAANSAQTARVVGRPFRPGESGNVNGRPKRDADFAAACRERAPRVLAVLEKSLRSASWREQHSAALILLNYGFGKPVQLLSQGPEASIQVLHLLACQRLQSEAELGVRPETASTETQSSQPLTIDALAALPPPLE